MKRKLNRTELYNYEAVEVRKIRRPWQWQISVPPNVAVYTALVSPAGDQTLILCRKFQPSFKGEMRSFCMWHNILYSCYFNRARFH